MFVTHIWLSSLHYRYVRYDEDMDGSWMWINRTDLTDGVGRHARRIASELECRGVYLGSWRIGCMLKACLLFMDIMIAEFREGRFSSYSFKSVFAPVTLDVLKRIKQSGKRHEEDRQPTSPAWEVFVWRGKKIKLLLSAALIRPRYWRRRLNINVSLTPPTQRNPARPTF